jgi:hypothetical protein
MTFYKVTAKGLIRPSRNTLDRLVRFRKDSEAVDNPAHRPFVLSLIGFEPESARRRIDGRKQEYDIPGVTPRSKSPAHEIGE